MPEIPSDWSTNSSMTIIIEFIPVAEEEDDLDTLAFVQKVRINVQQELQNSNEYMISIMPTNERNIDVIVLLTLIGASIAATKDLLTSFFNMVTAALELLAKKDHVREIEIIVDGKPLILRDLKKKTAKELMEALRTQQLETEKRSISSQPLKITTRISKKRSRKH